MYADKLEAESGSRKVVKDRINGGSSGNISTRLRQVTGKRQRQDDKWEHDLFSSDKPQLSTRRVDPRDLRLKLQKRQHGSQSGREAGSGVRDLREKLSGTMNQPKNIDPPKSKVEAARPSMKSVATETETRKTSNQATRKKSQQADASVDSFLESLGLEKYSTAFQVEEVDMDALMHMTDDDLKAMLIPMGPRKKILLALGSKR
ncbi:PREDICTED: ankyrin repeat and SAM domain-containing protein 6-like [Camelina sativa]|uniref:Ankyrin repeat and SAM domain-containing protein 6-like n=1 Tax=Camelina sativa TaxID=90675 RepID=A0ABM0V1Q7_CAMSA|nr:PREDICTED: ankyrin repeat and SAM domain-containing protein 6-like [Camelina sativa]